MTMPPEQIEVECSKCQTRFKTWHRPSINLRLERFSDEYIRKMSTAVCPRCNCKIALNTLIVAEDGTWHLGPVQGKNKDRQKGAFRGKRSPGQEAREEGKDMG
jgi:hypothetical protein